MDKRPGQSRAPYTPAEGSRRRSFLSAVFNRSHGRSPDTTDALPPSYESAVAPSFKSSSWRRKSTRGGTFENALELLRKYDTVLLVDDSGSMVLPGSKKGRTRWYEAGEALATLAETAQQYDSDGIDIHFLNSRMHALNVKSSHEVRDLFNNVRPCGATPTGERLDQLLKPRLRLLEGAHIDPDGTPKDRRTGEEIKRVNFIVITDGEASDNPKYPIIDAAARLQAMPALCMIQLGIQFVQVGNDSAATRALKELDNDLHKTTTIRDIVDTTPYSKLNPISADGLMKVLLGAINRRIDEQPN
ncbi:hypothetical protein GGX14DRAFT_209430 [Mycena pura]|uniref:VWFA domain-containing protein n=1 Tax=Mycena pura TaxID=153505 RepID=A0AAD6UTV3_9AGAR|nr:hypothetical protein GGX14DRAFT_209430 [Mycena pura]